MTIDEKHKAQKTKTKIMVRSYTIEMLFESFVPHNFNNRLWWRVAGTLSPRTMFFSFLLLLYDNFYSRDRSIAPAPASADAISAASIPFHAAMNRLSFGNGFMEFYRFRIYLHLRLRALPLSARSSHFGVMHFRSGDQTWHPEWKLSRDGGGGGYEKEERTTEMGP